MKIVPLDETGWLARLQEPATAVGIDLASAPFRMPHAGKWDTSDQSLPEHLLYFVAQGACSAVLAGERVTLGEGTICWVNPGTVFRFFSDEGQSPVIWRFRLTVRRGKSAWRLPWKFRTLRAAWPAFDWIRQLAQESGKTGRFDGLRRRSLVTLLSIWVFEQSRAAHPQGALLGDAAREAIWHRVAENPAARLGAADLARQLGFSPDYFSRIFRRSYGLSPKSWLLKQRLNHAAALLQESKIRITDLALRLGYVDVYLFSRQFRREFGMSPRAWRQLGRAGLAG